MEKDIKKLINTDIPFLARTNDYTVFSLKATQEMEKYARLSNDVFYKYNNEARELLKIISSLGLKEIHEYFNQ